jgi:F0F1-type ATP synthase membrane subunit b/b'
MQISLTPDYSLLAIMVIFIINYLVVSKFFIKPINAVLESRDHETRSANEVYEQAMTRFSEETSRMEEQLHVAKREAAAVREKFRAEATTHRASVIERTGAESKSIVSDADASLNRATSEAREKIKRESEALARLAAERILGRVV